MSKPICESCKHCRPGWAYIGGYCTVPDFSDARCALTDLVSLGGRQGVPCADMRGPGGECGADGSLYEAKPEPPQLVLVESKRKPWRWWRVLG